MALAQDENADVRAAACGTIGALSYYPWIRSDITILSGFAKRLPGLCDDTNLKVRIRAFWAVGSLVDALRSRTEDVESKLNAIEIKGNLNAIDVAHSDSERTAETMRGIFDLSTDLKLNLLRSMIAGCRDQEKVRSHAFRALGRIIDLIPGDELAKMGDSLDGALNALVSNLTSGPIKNRWNACHCLKSLFGYPGFPLGTNVAYTKPLFKSLVEVSSSSTNFKVKTGAILALTSVASLDRFETPQDTAENLILMILRGLIETVKSIDVVFIRATLEEQTYQFQLCDALSNLVNHLRVICSSSWTEEMHSLAIEISGLVGTVGKSKTSFDPHGL